MPEKRFHPQVYELRPWYHDFARLGLQTVFDEPPHIGARAVDLLRRLAAAARRAAGVHAVEKGERFSMRTLLAGAPPSHRVNQRDKEQVVIPLIQQALQGLEGAPSCLDLFCADGYYSCTIAHLCPAAAITGVDLDPAEIRRAETAARLLGVAKARFVVADVVDFVRQAAPHDLILCTGGLYHLQEPRHLLQRLYPISTHFLVVQSVVTLESESPDYFVSPAPGWKHGSRFTHAALRRWLEEIGWEIVAAARNELSGNSRPCDRGSSYFLCHKGAP
ncbi:MAG: class I SAM-dependent methyltransferase [Anaerolineae bacterium]|nr:class I SAM-dependent methyltransferase [Anaerolineae bacterium]